MLGYEPVDIQEDPVEYVNELNDICSDQKSESVRCYCLKLLANLAEYSDGFLTFAT
jgi:hypothetical protein